MTNESKKEFQRIAKFIASSGLSSRREAEKMISEYFHATIPEICHFFPLTYFEAWKFYTQKCVNLRQKLPRDKTA